MLEYAIHQTSAFLIESYRENRRGIGQYFTGADLAVFGASFFDPTQRNSAITVIDPGAGTGVLSAAFATQFKNQSIHLIAYEMDPCVLPILKNTLQYIQKKHKSFSFDIRETDYLKEADKERADYIICNPPYKKISPKSSGIQDVCCVNNLYSAFMVRAIQDLKSNGEVLFIVPRSWTAGLYFKPLRKFLNQQCYLERIHIFRDREDIFDTEMILQDVVLAKFRKTNERAATIISVSDSLNQDAVSSILPKSFCSWGDDECLILPYSKEEESLIQNMVQTKTTMQDFGFQSHTGVTVRFRAKERIFDHQVENSIPLVVSDCVSDKFHAQKVEYLIPKENEKLPNQWYVIFRRICPKENHGKIIPVIYDPSLLQADFISIEISLLFIACKSKEECEQVKSFMESESCQALNHSIMSSNGLSVKTLSNYPFSLECKEPTA